MDDRAEALTLTIWGRPEQEIREFLRTKQYTDSEILSLISELRMERHRLIRQRAKQRLIYGGLVGLLCSAYILHGFLNEDVLKWLRGPRPGLSLGLACTAAAWGTWRSIGACFNLIRPERVQGNLE